MQKRLKLVFPKKSDYPNRLKILDHPNRSTVYHQLVEASASAYFETKGPARWIFRKRFQIALNWLNQLPKINSLLDAGSGIGFFLPSLAKTVGQITAVDYAQHTLRYAKEMCRKKKINNIKFIQADLLTLKLPLKKFDCLVALSILEHILPLQLKQLMKKFSIWLKPGGYLIAGYPNEGSQLFEWIKNLEKKLLRPKVYKSLHDAKADYQPLGHVAKAKEIHQSIINKFTLINEYHLPFSWLKFYSLGLFTR